MITVIGIHIVITNIDAPQHGTFESAQVYVMTFLAIFSLFMFATCRCS